MRHERKVGVTDRLSVLVVDDHQLVLEAVRAALEGESEIHVVGEALSGQEALALAERLRPDVVLLDLGMPGMDGMRCLVELKDILPETRVVVLTGRDDPDLAEDVLSHGASAFVSKHVDPSHLAAVLREVVDGTIVSHVVQTSGQRRERAAREAGLTERELVVLAALAAGGSNKQIAFQLHVSEQAVKYHLTNIYRKLDTANRVETLVRASDLGLVDTRTPVGV
jgi:two-component system, NarL family, response regulator LiaR